MCTWFCSAMTRRFGDDDPDAFPAVYRLPVVRSIRLSDLSGIDLSIPFQFLSVTDRELSLVCPTERVPAATVEREDGWRAFRIAGQLDFSLVGVISAITTLLASRKIGVFVVSTFETDYVLVKQEHQEAALSLLSDAGHDVEREPLR